MSENAFSIISFVYISAQTNDKPLVGSSKGTPWIDLQNLFLLACYDFCHTRHEKHSLPMLPSIIIYLIEMCEKF